MEKLHIYYLVMIREIPRKTVALDFQLSATTIRNIIRKIENEFISKTDMKPSTKRNLMFSRKIGDMIQTFLSSSTTPKILKKHIYKCSNVRVPIHLISQYIQEKLGMSYKIGKSRPMLFDTERNMLIKWYFTVRIVQIIGGSDMIVNIDKASF